MQGQAVTGMVLSSMPIGEYDRRVVILTRERGKISAFARGSRRPNSPLSACCRTFCTGEFDLFTGRDSYSLRSAKILDWFEDLAGDLDAAVYAYYFAELADWCTRENNDESRMLELLYRACRALTRGAIPPEMIKAVFELKAMTISGEYPGGDAENVSDTVRRAHDLVVESGPAEMFTFSLQPEYAEEFGRLTEKIRERHIGRRFSSLDVLKQLSGADQAGE